MSDYESGATKPATGFGRFIRGEGAAAVESTRESFGLYNVTAPRTLTGKVASPPRRTAAKIVEALVRARLQSN